MRPMLKWIIGSARKSQTHPGPASRAGDSHGKFLINASLIWCGSSRNWFAYRDLREFDGGDRPLPIVAPDRDSQTVQFVKPDVFHRTGLSVREHYGLPDKLRLRFLERAENRRCAKFHSWHGRSGVGGKRLSESDVYL